MAPTLKTLVSFNGAGDGAGPDSGVVIDANGNLLGTTQQGGPDETDNVGGIDIVGGTVFEIPYADGSYASTPTVLDAFAGPNGDTPLGSLIIGPNGNLYGTTSAGGSTYTVLDSGATILGKGVVYEVPYSGGSYGAPSVLYSDTVGFTSMDYGLGLDSQGDLFGTLSTEETFEFPNDDGSYLAPPTLFLPYPYTAGPPGNGTPAGAPQLGPDGNLFVSYDTGGSYGMIYELTFGSEPVYSGGQYGDAWSLVAAFDGVDGAAPNSVIFDKQGDIFGTTADTGTQESSGDNGFGEVFEITDTNGVYASTPTVLATFDGADGRNPSGRLIMDAAGDLFGATYYGGADDDGVVFELAKVDGAYSSTPTVLYSFDGADGANPLGPLTANAAGELFGTTVAGGADGDGTVFEVSGFATYTVAQALALIASNPRTTAPQGVIDDTAANVETLTAGQVTALVADGFVEAESDDTTLALSVSVALAAQGAGMTVAAPSGSAAAVLDAATTVETLTPNQISNLATDGFNEITSNDAALDLSVAQATAATNGAVKLVDGSGVDLDDTDAAIDALTPQEIALMGADGVRDISSDNTALTLTVADATSAIASGVDQLGDPSGDRVTIADTAASISALTPSRIAALINAGVQEFQSTDAELDLTVEQGLAIADDDATVSGDYSNEFQGDFYSLLGKVASITPAQITSLGAAGFDLMASNAEYGLFYLNVEQSVAVVDANIDLVGEGAVVYDSNTNIQSLTPKQITELKQRNFTVLDVSTAPDSTLTLSVEQLLALEGSELPVGSFVDIIVVISDTAANIEALSTDELVNNGLTIAGYYVYLYPNDVGLQLSVEQGLAIVDGTNGRMFVGSTTGPSLFSAGVTDSAQNIEALSAGQFTAFGKVGFTLFTSNAGGLILSLAQALAIDGIGDVKVSAPTGEVVEVSDAAANFQALLPNQIANLGISGFTLLAANDAGLKLDLYQALAVIENGMTVTAPTGQAVEVDGLAADLQGLDDTQIKDLGNAGFTVLNATDYGMKLKVEQALAIIGVTGMSISAPSGAIVAIDDNAANIQALTADQITSLGAAGFARLESTDANLDLTVAQAMAVINNDDMTVAAPSGSVAEVDDDANDIQTLSADQISQLGARGFTVLESNDGAVNLSVDQAVALVNAKMIMSPSSTATVLDTAANIATLTTDMIADLGAGGFSSLESSDTNLALSVAQATAIVAGGKLDVSAPVGDFAAIDDTMANLEGLTEDQITDFSKVGFTLISSNDGTLDMAVQQASYLDAAGFKVAASDAKAEIQDTAANLDALTTDQIADFAKDGFNELAAFDQPVEFTVAQALAVADAGTLSVSCATSSASLIEDKALQIDGLTAAEIATMAGDGFTALDSLDQELQFTVDQALAVANSTDMSVESPANADVVSDTADNIEALTAGEITNLGLRGFTVLQATDGGLEFNIDQALAFVASGKLTLAVPDGASIGVSDSADNIATLTTDQLGALGNDGFTRLGSDDGALTLTVEQALAVVDGGKIALSATAGAAIEASDASGAFSTLTADQIGSLAQAGFTLFASDDGDLDLSVQQALALLGETPIKVSAPTGSSAAVYDTPDALQALTADQISNLAADGFDELSSSGGDLTFSAAQALAIVDKGMKVSAPDGGSIAVLDAPDAIEALTADQIASLGADGFGGLSSSGGDLTFTAEQALAIVDKGMKVSAPNDASIVVSDTPDAIESLAADQIASLGAAGFSVLSSSGGDLTFTAEQALAISDQNMKASAPDGASIIMLATPDAIEALTADQIILLGAAGFVELSSSGGDLTLTVDQAQAIVVNAIMKVSAPDGASIVVRDGPDALQGLTADQIASLGADGVDELSSNGGDLSFSVDQALAVVDDERLRVSAPQGAEVVVLDAPDAIQALTAEQITSLGADGFAGLTSSAGDLDLTVEQALAAIGSPSLSVAAPTGSNVVVLDSGDAFASLTQDQIASLGKNGFTRLGSNDGDLDLTVQQALAVDAAKMTVSAENATVAISDAPDAFTSLSADQIAAFAKDGFGELASNSGNLVLSVSQALAADAAGMTVTAPQGETAEIADVNTAIDALTPTQIADLAQDGFGEIMCTAGELYLTVAQALAIEKADLAIVSNASPAAGVVDTAANVQKNFDALNDDGDVSSILLTDSGAPVLDLTDAQAANDTTALGEILNVDYSVVTPSSTTLVIGASATLTSFPTNAPNPSVLDLEGHSLTLDPAAGQVTNFAGVIEDGGGTAGALVVDGGGTVELSGVNTFSGGITVESGTLELDDAEAAGVGPITFPDDPTLEINGAIMPTNVIKGFAPGDAIDLTSIPFTGGQPALNAGNVLSFTEGGATYALNFDPSQDFSDSKFEISAGSGGGSVIQSILVIAINGAQADQPVADSASITPFAATTLVDVTGTLDTLTVTLNDPGSGSLADPNAATDGSSYESAEGSFTVTGTLASVEAALQGLVFVPTRGEVAVGQSVTTDFAVALSDAAGQSAQNDTTSVVALGTAPTVTLDPVDGDNVIDNAEAAAAGGIPLSGTVSGLAAGATFSVTFVDDGAAKSYVATVDAAGTGWNATLPESDASALANGDATLTAQATDASGDPSAVATEGVSVDLAGTATGDVHMKTYDGLHYDFQADGTFVLTRSTTPGDGFQIQIQTSPYPRNDAASITTQAAVELGADVLVFDPGAANFVSVDGAADTTLSAANPTQIFADGKLVETSPSTYEVDWNSGETLTLTDDGYYIDSSVALGPQNAPGSVQGLLGPDEGQANDFQLPDGGALAQPLSKAELLGAFADAWSVTPSESLFGGGATPLSFADAGQDVLQATSAGQTLDAGSGIDVLSDAGGLGAIFRGSLAALSGDLIAGFCSEDVIDVAGFDAAHALLSCAGSSAMGVLTLSDGNSTGELYLSGALSGGTFHAASDGMGGSRITFG